MKDKLFSFKATYCSPTCSRMECYTEGILCQSSDENDGKNESYDSWNNYENDGWN